MDNKEKIDYVHSVCIETILEWQPIPQKALDNTALKKPLDNTAITAASKLNF